MTIRFRNKGLFFDLYCIVSILFLLYTTGNYFVLKTYSTSIPIFFAFEFISTILLESMQGKRFLVSQKSLLLIFLSIIVFFASMIMNTFEDLSSYIAILLQMVCALIISIQIDEGVFKDKYVRIITCFAVISLVFYFVSIISPSIVYVFPQTKRTDLNLNYYNAYVYVFWEETGWSSTFLSKRNAGIFLEPGAYQAFLNYALYLVLCNERYKNRGIVAAILIITIVTTYSVTGYIVAAIVLSSFLIWKGKNRYMIIVMMAGAVLLFILGYNNALVTNKIMDLKYISERISLPQLSLLFTKFKSYLFGFTFTGRNSIGLSSTVWNSIIDSCFVFGIPYVAILLVCYYKSCRRYEHGLLLFICLIFFFSAESFIWRPFFLLIIFYSLLPKQYYSQFINERKME